MAGTGSGAVIFSVSALIVSRTAGTAAGNNFVASRYAEEARAANSTIIMTLMVFIILGGKLMQL